MLFGIFSYVILVFRVAAPSNLWLDWDWDLMADTRSTIKFFSFLTLLACLAEFKSTNLTYNSSKDTCSLAIPSYRWDLVKIRRKHRFKLAVKKSSKHGPVVLCLPETVFVLWPFGQENILRSGDVQFISRPAEDCWPHSIEHFVFSIIITQLRFLC